MVMIMKSRGRTIKLLALAMLGLMLSGCVTYYERGDGVYYEPRAQRAHHVALIDPLVYPYWSLDHFYFSHYYHPYSVVVHRYDPWYYPFPGWYYAHRPGYHHPWYGYGSRYRYYQPWYVGGYFSFGDHRSSQRHRVKQLDARLHELETRRSLAVRSQRPDRTALMPRVSQRLPANRRTPTDQRLAPARGPALERQDRSGLALERRAELLRRLDDRDRPRTIDPVALPDRSGRTSEAWRGRQLPESLPSRPPERTVERTPPRDGARSQAPVRQPAAPPARQQRSRNPVSVPDNPPSRSPARTRDRPPARSSRNGSSDRRERHR